MDFQDSLAAGWARHAAAPDDVYRDALALAESPPAEGISALANLLFHVGGEHLGRFQDVGTAVERLLPLAADPAAASPLFRILAACALCTGAPEKAREYEAGAAGDPGVNSGLVRGLAACALATQGQTAQAGTHFDAAVLLADSTEGLHRSIAATGNNLAVGLEQRVPRTPAEDTLMLKAAEVARVFWERAGTWMSVERAEYRLAMTRLARGEPGLAATHAERVLSIVGDNGGNPGEEFFGWEALARARHAEGDSPGAGRARDSAAACLPRVEDDTFRVYCTGSLKALDSTLG